MMSPRRGLSLITCLIFALAVSEVVADAFRNLYGWIMNEVSQVCRQISYVDVNIDDLLLTGSGR